MTVVLVACTAKTPTGDAPEPEPQPPPNGCGELSYGIYHNPGDEFEDIASRHLGELACAIPCDPPPALARGPEGRNEHGGYGFVEFEPRACQFEGMTLAIDSCVGVCEHADRLGRFQVELGDRSEASRAALCTAFEQRWGPPDIGSCDCLEHEIVWRPRAGEPGVVLHFLGTYSIECGFPDANYLPTDPL